MRGDFFLFFLALDQKQEQGLGMGPTYELRTSFFSRKLFDSHFARLSSRCRTHIGYRNIETRKPSFSYATDDK